MDEEIRQISLRVKALREILKVTTTQAARSCGFPEEEYLKFESGQIDIPIGILHRLAKSLGVETSTFLSGDEPRMRSYTLTRKGQGVAIERRRAYKYQSLAANFINRKAEPFLVKVEAKPESSPVELNTHPGQEFNLILKGSMKFYLNDKEMLLNEGDSIYFDSGIPHGMKALDNKACEFLAIIF